MRYNRWAIIPLPLEHLGQDNYTGTHMGIPVFGTDLINSYFTPRWANIDWKTKPLNITQTNLFIPWSYIVLCTALMNITDCLYWLLSVDAATVINFTVTGISGAVREVLTLPLLPHLSLSCHLSRCTMLSAPWTAATARSGFVHKDCDDNSSARAGCDRPWLQAVRASSVPHKKAFIQAMGSFFPDTNVP